MSLQAELLSRLHHPCIVGYRESILVDDVLSIVMEYCDGGDLSERILEASESDSPFDEAQILDWFTQIALALKHIHDMNILHRDLKTQNVFLTKENRIKLGDFGISKILNSDTDFARTAIGMYRTCSSTCSRRFKRCMRLLDHNATLISRVCVR